MGIPSTAIITAVAVGLLAAQPAAAERKRPGLDGSRWQEDLEKVGERLRAGDWKKGRRSARRLAEEILGDSWYGRGLKEVLAELAFYQAAAEANLGDRRLAVWYWHMAQNLDPRIRDQDLAPYGEATKLLREFPLRARGQVPPSFQVVRPGYGRGTSRAVLAGDWAPVIPYNPAAAGERPGDLHLELIVDRHGRPHQPVVITGGTHPVAVYGTLDAMRDMPPFEPARDAGVAVDSLFKYVVALRSSRWDQGGPRFTGTIQ